MTQRRNPAVENRTDPEVEQFPSTGSIVRWLSEGSPPPPAPDDGPEHDFRPLLRPPVPVLTVLDDGSQDRGEDHRIRERVCTIGRTEGMVRIPHDMAISGCHAEIRRTPWRGAWQWHLHDVTSVNGTFVRCVRAILNDQSLLILGARRFQLRNPLGPGGGGEPGAGHTRIADGGHIPRSAATALVEASTKPDALAFPIRGTGAVIGRLGGGADIEIDDPLLADRHAVLERQRDGTWLIASQPSKNGIWVSISTVALSAHCFFRCGEQRFRFMVP